MTDVLLPLPTATGAVVPVPAGPAVDARPEAPVRPLVRPRSRAGWALPAVDLLTTALGAVVAGVLAAVDRPAALVVALAWVGLLAAHCQLRPADGQPRLHRVRILARPAVLLALGGSLLADLPAGSFLVPPAVTDLRAGQALVLAGSIVGCVALGRLVTPPVAAPPLLVAGASLTAVSHVAAAFRRAQPRSDVLSVRLVANAGDRPEAGDDSCRVGDLAAMAADAGACAVVLVATGDDPLTAVRRLQWELESAGRRLLLAPGPLDVCPARATTWHVDGQPLIEVLPSRHAARARSLLVYPERLAAVLALLLLSPLLLVVAALVRLDSSGPALFRQVRTGRGGQEFVMYKYRTMTCTSSVPVELVNEADGVLFKIRRDPRVTRLGAVLRRYSVDELPQLINVALGEMSFVGPRPALPSEVAAYDFDTRRRLAVRPGLTGLWQVSGRSDLSWQDTVRLDLHYVDNWSLRLDLCILWRTVGAVLRHRGAY